MVRYQINIHRSNGVVGAHQVDLFVPGEIAHVDETEIAVGEQKSGRLRVLAGIILALWRGCAKWIGLACARQRRLTVTLRR